MCHDLKSERLYLKQICEKDRIVFYSLVENTEVIKYCFSPLEENEKTALFNSRIEPWNCNSLHWLCLSIFHIATGEFIGVTGFKRVPNSEKLECGFLFLPNFHGFGYATESLNTVIEYAQGLGFTDFVANVTMGNIASVKVLEKCGFNNVVIEEGAVNINEQFYSNLVYCR